MAYVVLQRIANESADGRVATTRIQALQQKKAAELNEKNKQLTTAQQKLEKEGAVMSAAVGAELQKTIEKLNVEVQRFTQDAQAEVQELQQTLQQEFQQRLEPVLQQVATDMGLQFVFNGPDAGLVWADAALDISGEVIKKLDSAKPPHDQAGRPDEAPGSVSAGASDLSTVAQGAAKVDILERLATAFPRSSSTPSPSTSRESGWSRSRTSPSTKISSRAISPASR